MDDAVLSRDGHKVVSPACAVMRFRHLETVVSSGHRAMLSGFPLRGGPARQTRVWFPGLTIRLKGFGAHVAHRRRHRIHYSSLERERGIYIEPQLTKALD